MRSRPLSLAGYPCRHQDGHDVKGRRRGWSFGVLLPPGMVIAKFTWLVAP